MSEVKQLDIMDCVHTTPSKNGNNGHCEQNFNNIQDHDEKEDKEITIDQADARGWFGARATNQPVRNLKKKLVKSNK